jgi:hypothetical protein
MIVIMDESAIEKFIQLGERVCKPSQLQKAKESAHNLALSEEMSMAVVELDRNHYQVWSVVKAGKDAVYVAEYVKDGAEQ